MNILLTGSTGFVGHTVATALTRAGHTVHGGVSPRRRTLLPLQIPMDFARDTTADVWLPRLAGIDAVVNAVGVLRDSAALGIDGNNTRYASTKRAADAHLLGLAAQGALSAAVLRPSVVFGKGGDSSALFMNLARLPLAVLPGPMRTARVQPVSVHDLAAAIVALLGPSVHTTGIIECTGPEALTMEACIASLRQQLGSSPAHVLGLPDVLTQLSARLGDAIPSVPWCTETLTMLGSDNVGNPAVFEQLLGRKGVHHSHLVASAWR